METFTGLTDFVPDLNYQIRRKKILSKDFYLETDFPVRDIVKNINELLYCFTLQSCYGHFVLDSGESSHSLKSFSKLNQSKLKYKIAYLALCIENLRDEIFTELADIIHEINKAGAA